MLRKPAFPSDADSEDLAPADYLYANFSNVDYDHLCCSSPENNQSFENPGPKDFEKLEKKLKNLKKG